MNTRTLTRLGILLALTIALAAAEQAIPPVPFLPPGMKLGFSHVVVMYSVFHVGKKQSILLAVLKSLFALLTRGPMAAALSFSGGMLSLAVLMILVSAYPQISYALAGVLGAVTHNIGQLAVYSLIARVNILAFYMPILILSGIVAGLFTGTLLKWTEPLMMKLDGRSARGEPHDR